MAEASCKEIKEKRKHGGDVEHMPSTRSSAPSSCSGAGAHRAPPNAHVRNYDVFLNHRGPDVKRSFVDHLSASLETAGVHSFVDYKELYKGEGDWPAIESAIHHSKIHIAIFSPGYADSSWCLKELHEMLECRANRISDLFLPVFYKVEPSDLRHSSSPRSRYSSALKKLLAWNHQEVVEKWNSALNEASNVNGWTLTEVEGFEARLVKLIVSEVLNVLNRTLLDIAKHPVGVNEKLREALDLMKIDDKAQKGVHILGIVGMGGVGKTTLAKFIYNDIYRQFQCWSFMQNVRDEAKAFSGLRGVQDCMLRELLKQEVMHPVKNTSLGRQIMKERLSGMKILIILDDVDDPDQLDELLPLFDSWGLKDGSQIVITTRDEQIVIFAKAQQKTIMHIEGLKENHARELFNWHAFLSWEEPSEDFKTLAKKVVGACQGLPLALETLGSHLYGRGKDFWKETVKVLEGNRRSLPPGVSKVMSILRISFDGLGREEERSMFLDIACFMLGEPEARAKRIWSESDAAELCLETLKLKCLVKLDEHRRLTMHDLLRDMGREIVQERRPQKIWKRSHLWNEDDVRCVLRNQKGTSEVRGVCLAKYYGYNNLEEWDTKSFAGMDVLQILVLRNVNITGNFTCFSKELRWFQWRNCPLESLPCELALNNVAVLDLQGSNISSLSPGHLCESLRELNLRNCRNLKELPEFTDGCCKTLEMLDLRGCHNLESLPKSIGLFSSSLKHLDLRECTSLRTLPDGIVNLHSIKSLLLHGCLRLTRLPDAIGLLTMLEEIGLNSHDLTTIPQSFGNLTNLSSLFLHSCSSLKELPQSFGNLTNLSSLSLDACDSIKELPQSFGNLTNLSSLDLSKCNSLKELPSTIGNLRKLTSFTMEECPLIWEIPQRVSSLTNLVDLKVTHCDSLKELPSTIGNLRKLTSFTMKGCPLIWEIPQGVSFLTNLVDLRVTNCESMSRLPENIGNLHKLVTLDLHQTLCYLPSSIGQLEEMVTLVLENCNIGDGGLPTEYSTLSSLQQLNLGRNFFSRLPENFHLLSKLQTLNLDKCKNLREISHLPPSLTALSIRGASSLTRLSRLSSLTKLRKLVVQDCRQLGELVGLGCLSDLEELELVGYRGYDLPQSASSLTSLRLLRLGGSGVSLLQDNAPWIQKLGSVERVHVSLDGEVKVPECFSSCKFEWIKAEKIRELLTVVNCTQSAQAGFCKGIVCCFMFSSPYPQIDLEGDSPTLLLSHNNSRLHWRLFDCHSDLFDHTERMHIAIFRATHPFVASLKGGDTISASLLNDYGGTICCHGATQGAVKMLCDENEMQEILQELSTQIDLHNIQAVRKGRAAERVDEQYWRRRVRLMEDPIKLEVTNWSVDGGLPDANNSTLSSLQKMDLAFMPISQLPSNFHFLMTNLTSLDLRECTCLREIPSLPPTLVDLDLGGSNSLQAILCLSSLTELRDLVLCDCTQLVELVGLDCLVHLSQLNISGCQRLERLPSGLEKLTSLKFLYMAGSGVSMLQDNEPWIQKLPSLELMSVYADEVTEVPEGLLDQVKVMMRYQIKQEHGNVCVMQLELLDCDQAAFILYFVSRECEIYEEIDQELECDQEIDCEYGRYQNGCTSTYVEVIERETDNPKFSQVLFVNRSGDLRKQLHISIFRESHPLVTSLKGGDTIRVLAMSSDKRTHIQVNEGAAHVLSGENELDQTLRKLSRQVQPQPGFTIGNLMSLDFGQTAP